MVPTSELSFVVEVEDDPRGWVIVSPLIDGVHLSDLVERFELDHGMAPAGGYDGTAVAGESPRAFAHGGVDAVELARHFLGDPADTTSRGRRWRFGRSRNTRVRLLACDGCYESGCWPGEMIATRADGVVEWAAFRNPHRRDRDYAGFGPFRFDEQQSLAAIGDLQRALLMHSA
ncbi:hypothetical protein [Cellulomonas sp. NS3]|uniref:hypothetical protein n=1 Tax=Cellulomonas sp. NS3 TaxID=2973977 RepID=UPI002163DE51|nr:hypothetical protein [Cellulomonas sp. NS3]